MPTQSFSARVLDAGAALRVPRPAWASTGALPPRRLGLLVLVGIAGLLAIVYLTLRLTPLSTVQRVTVVGVQGPDAVEIRNAIERAAMGQSTLGFGDGAVERAVAGTESITGVTVHTKFPHAVQVEVDQLLAVGAVEVQGRKVAVSADGRLLPDWDVGELPLIRGARASGDVVRGSARAATAILGLAPTQLLAHVARVDDGTTVRIADGPALLFRDTDRLNAKWAAAVAVLGDPGTRGATWIDLRVPEAPVAGKGAPPALPSRTARVGEVAGTADALSTAERAASQTGDAPAAGSAATTPAASGTGAATPTAASATAAPAAPATTGAGGQATTAPGAGTAPAAGTGSPASGTGPASTGTGGATSGGGAGTNSAPTGTTAPPAATTGTAPGTGGGTAPTAQTTP